MHWENLGGAGGEGGGGEIRMGNTCKPMADSFQCMTKFTTNKKKKNKKDLRSSAFFCSLVFYHILSAVSLSLPYSPILNAHIHALYY